MATLKITKTVETTSNKDLYDLIKSLPENNRSREKHEPFDEYLANNTPIQHYTDRLAEVEKDTDDASDLINLRIALNLFCEKIDQELVKIMAQY